MGKTRLGIMALVVLGAFNAGCQTDMCPPGVSDSIFCRGYIDASFDGCVQGGACNPPDDLCAVGIWQCIGASGPTCQVVSRLSPGDPCGGGGFTCADDGSCSICVQDAVCNTGNPCLGGHQECGTDPPVCLPDTPADGMPCGTGGICGGELCSECIPDVICNTGNPCTTGHTRCVDANTTECVPDADLPPGVSCSEGLACNGSGECTVCNEGTICNTGNPCATGHTDCGSGSPVCVPDMDAPPGTGCGTGGICSGAGECSECIDGTVCNTGNPCTTGTQACPGGMPVCMASSNLPSGVRCGVGRACDGSGNCNLCVPGDPCVTTTCEVGTTDCTSGMPVCMPTGPAPPGAVCRPRVDACDIEEVCSGSGAACPPDRFAPAGTACIDRGMCDGMGICIPFCVQDAPCNTGNDCEVGTTDCSSGSPVCVAGGPRASGTVCRASTNPCDAEEACDGSSLTCPVDANEPPGTMCPTGVCDPAGMCVMCVDGAPCTPTNPCEAGQLDCSSGAPVCVPSGPAPMGTLCRAVAGVCDVEERCDGTTTMCPPDAFDATTLCRASVAPCDAAETCDGSGVTCPADAPAPPGTICPGGVCDGMRVCAPCIQGLTCMTANTCEVGQIDCASGAPVCQAVGLQPSGTVCRASTGACDTEETCTGASPTCPPDALTPVGTVCRPVVGACDVQEVCTGISNLCPPDGVAPAGTTCRSPGGACDAAESCDGISNVCPADILTPSGVVCRPAIDVCDQDELCTGSAAACPTDMLRPAGSICRMAVDVCDLTEACNGGSAACPPNGFATLGTTCPAGVCDGSGGCSMCGGICPMRPNATTTCGGSCGYVCLTGFADCNAGAADGCEINTTMDTGNCGGCGNACPSRANANTTCMSSACGYSCFPNFADCNGSSADGCEIDTAVDILHCGACPNVCPTRANATTTCASGSCGFTCNGTFGDCNTNPADGCEIDTSNNLSHCGFCGNACPARAHATTTCASSTCGYTCDPGWGDCNGSGADGCEVDTTSTLAHCGGCGIACPTPANATRTCVASSCGYTCNAGFEDCNGSSADGCEVNRNTDVNNCGGCGIACPNRPNAMTTCSAGACGYACLPGYVDCNGNPADGCEINTAGDPDNCGFCGNVCQTGPNGSRSCVASSCQFNCFPGYGNCNGLIGDGCEIQTTDNINHCGGCGNVCPSRPNSTAVCSSSACGYNCSAGFGDCNAVATDGCEVNLQTSVSNCGSCGFGCNLPNAVEACSGAVCVVSACDPDAYDVDMVSGNGCECLDNDVGPFCSTPTGVGSIAIGGGTSVSGRVAEVGGSEWYQVSFPMSTGTFGGGTPTISFTVNDGNEFRFDIVGGSCTGSNPWCGGQASLTSWSIVDNVSTPGVNQFTTRSEAWPDTIWVRVYRVTGGESCANFTLSITRP